MVKPICERSHYASIVDAQKASEIYHRGDFECADCLRSMVEKHVQIAEIFRARLASLTVSSPKRCRIYGTACLNPTYCDARDACCAGDPDCRLAGDSDGAEVL